MLSVEDIAEYLGVSKDTIYTRVTAGKIPGKDTGRKVLSGNLSVGLGLGSFFVQAKQLYNLRSSNQ